MKNYKPVPQDAFETSEEILGIGRHIGTYHGDKPNGPIYFYENGIEYDHLGKRTVLYRNLRLVSAPDGAGSKYLNINLKDGSMINLFPNGVSDLLAMIRYFMRVRDDAKDGLKF
ncbi:hypothetical protein ACWGTO_07735 [Mesorhizobium sp. PL10]